MSEWTEWGLIDYQTQSGTEEKFATVGNVFNILMTDSSRREGYNYAKASNGNWYSNATMEVSSRRSLEIQDMVPLDATVDRIEFRWFFSFDNNPHPEGVVDPVLRLDGFAGAALSNTRTINPPNNYGDLVVVEQGLTVGGAIVTQDVLDFLVGDDFLIWHCTHDAAGMPGDITWEMRYHYMEARVRFTRNVHTPSRGFMVRT